MHPPKGNEIPMKVVRARVKQPMFLPTGVDVPARLEILAYELDLDIPSKVSGSTPDTEWFTTYFGPFLLFWRDDNVDSDENEFIEDEINISGELEESIVPVEVRTKAHPESKVLFAPVSLAREILKQYTDGSYEYRVNDENARKGLVTYDLVQTNH